MNYFHYDTFCDILVSRLMKIRGESMDKGILKQLEQTRELMIESGLKYGFQNTKTIQLSKRLDELLNEYDMLTIDEKEGQIELRKFFQ